jgi:hypothetical protein
MRGRSCIPAPVRSNQRLWHLYLCFSTKHALLRRKSWLGIRIIFSSVATFLSADSCFSELALWKIQLRVLVKYKGDLIISSLTIIRYSWNSVKLALDNYHSLTQTTICIPMDINCAPRLRYSNETESTQDFSRKTNIAQTWSLISAI